MALDQFAMSQDAGKFSLVEFFNGKERVMADHESPLTVANAKDNVKIYLTRDDNQARAKISGRGQTMLSKAVWSMLGETPENSFCADCNASDPQFVCVNRGMLLCHQCAIVHHRISSVFFEAAQRASTAASAPKFFSKIRSINHCPWTEELIMFINHAGNALLNDVYEHTIVYSIEHTKPLPDATSAERERFIMAKYIDRLFVEPYHQASHSVAGPDGWVEFKDSDLDDIVRAMGQGLYDAAAANDLRSIIRLLALGVEINFSLQDEDAAGKTPLFAAASAGNLPALLILLENGADPCAVDGDGHTPLYYCALNAHASAQKVMTLWQLAHRVGAYPPPGDPAKLKLGKLSFGDFDNLVMDVLSEVQDRFLTNVSGRSASGMSGVREGRRKLAMLDEDQFGTLADNIFEELDVRQKDAVKRVRKMFATTIDSDAPPEELIVVLQERQEQEIADAKAAEDDLADLESMLKKPKKDAAATSKPPASSAAETQRPAPADDASKERNEAALREQKEKQERDKAAVDAERAERERADKERSDRERAEKERLELERLDRERREKEIVERERIERERSEKADKDNGERDRYLKAKAEIDRLWDDVQAEERAKLPSSKRAPAASSVTPSLLGASASASSLRASIAVPSPSAPTASTPAPAPAPFPAPAQQAASPSPQQPLSPAPSANAAALNEARVLIQDQGQRVTDAISQLMQTVKSGSAASYVEATVAVIKASGELIRLKEGVVPLLPATRATAAASACDALAGSFGPLVASTKSAVADPTTVQAMMRCAFEVLKKTQEFLLAALDD
eukprot:Opistho-2@15746